MGTDIHVYIEHRLPDGSWTPLWEPVPHPQYWYDNIVDARVKDQSAMLAFCTMDKDEASKAATLYYESLPMANVIEKFGRDPNLVTHWPYPTAAGRSRSAIASRDYQWFGLIAGLRGGTALFPERGLPEDVSWEVAREARQDDSDAHTHSWLMVSEILECAELARFPQGRWLQEHVPDPQNTRMVYWFDC